jgi:inhibitor of cysteine peptidase
MFKHSTRVLLLAATLAVGTMTTIGCQPSGKVGGVATESMNKGSITVQRGSDVEVKLPENPSTGYTWQRTSDLGLNVVAKVSSTYEGNDNPKGAVGVGGMRIFRYHAITKGICTLQYVLVPPGQKPSASDKSYTITIEVSS